MQDDNRIGDHVLAACQSAREHLLLCAPFVKGQVLRELLDQTADSVAIELFTRWRPEEVAAGVSDTIVLDIVTSCGGSVFLCDRLHGKYVRFDDRVLVGSANLTATALGWAASPNLEILIEVPRKTPQLLAFEESLRVESIVATDELASEVDRIAALLPRQAPPPEVLALDAAASSPSGWFPSLREPHDLFIGYSAGLARLARMSADAAAADLAALQVPPGLTRSQFDALVGSRLLQTMAVRAVDDLLEEPQRFGAVRDRLGQLIGLDRDGADIAWQTLMRWLLEFLPQRYDRRVANWSEILARRESVPGDSR